MGINILRLTAWLASTLIVSLKADAAVTLRPGQKINIIYSNSKWNKDAAEIDSGSLLIRDARSGRLVQVHLQESGPDTGQFVGLFSIFWSDDEIGPEVYVPDQELVQTKEGLAKLTEQIAQRKLKRRPFILRKGESAQTHLEVYDTREQTQAALNEHRKQALLAAAQARAKFEKEPSQINVADEGLAKERREKLRLAKLANAREAERRQMTQLESQRLNRISRDLRTLPPDELAKRIKFAQQVAAEAMAAYQKSNYSGAETLFRKALDLYPDQREYFYQYGVTLYKANKFNLALVYLSLADDPKINPVERKYYMALNYLKLKEMESGLKVLREVKAAQDPNISPSAAFYEGVTLFEDHQYEKARGPFQEVLDTSNDPRLDQTAEAYIDQIAKILAFEAERSKRFILTLSLGVQYDSNVPLVSDAAQLGTSASGKEGERYNFSAGLEWRHYFDRSYELATKYSLSTQYSLFGTEETPTLRQADATIASFSVPFRIKGLLFGHGNKFEIAPGFEQIMEAIEEERTTPILKSTVLKISDTFVNRENWFTVLSLEGRRDQSELSASVGDSDASAFKYSSNLSNLFLFGRDKGQMVNVDLGYSVNNADGGNYAYKRLDLGTGYRRPLIWNTAWNLGLTYYRMAYDQSTTLNRVENNFTYLTGLTRPLNDWAQLVWAASYSDNRSNQEDKNYYKFTTLLSLIATTSF